MPSCTFSCSQVPILFNMCSVDKLSDNSIQTVMYIKAFIRNCITGTVRKNCILGIVWNNATSCKFSNCRNNVIFANSVKIHICDANPSRPNCISKLQVDLKICEVSQKKKTLLKFLNSRYVPVITLLGLILSTKS